MGTAETQGQIWGTRARDWAEVQEGVVVPLYQVVLEKTKVCAGFSVLDVGCGSGMFCEMAAKLGANVSGIDAAEPLLSIAGERVAGGDFRVGEMEVLPYPDQTFDVVTGFSSFQFAANPENALREASRVSRNGSVVIAVFGKPEENETTVILKAIGSLLPTPPPGAPGPYALSADGALGALTTKAGLTPDEIGTVECPFAYPDEKTALRGLLSSGPAIRAIQGNGEEVVREAILKAISPFKTNAGGYHMRNTMRFLIAQAWFGDVRLEMESAWNEPERITAQMTHNVLSQAAVENSTVEAIGGDVNSDGG